VPALAPAAVAAAVSAPASRGRALARRIASAAVALPAFVWIVLFAPTWLFTALVLVVVGLGLRELTRLHAQAGQPMYGRLGPALGVLLAASFALPAESPGALVPGASILCLSAVTAVFLAAPLWRPGRPAIEPGALECLGVLHVGWFLGHAVLLHRLPEGPQLLLTLVGITWVGETAAYAVGSTVGRRPLAPVISPRKTVEGTVAQLIASLAAAVALGPPWLLPDWSVGRAVAAGLLVGVVGQVGDLAESAVKRSAGVKDSGGLLPGHGGILDRIDSLLFNVPAFYYYVRLGGAA
jgi:phosphatidate cytidylyltransferase